VENINADTNTALQQQKNKQQQQKKKQTEHFIFLRVT